MKNCFTLVLLIFVVPSIIAQESTGNRNEINNSGLSQVKQTTTPNGNSQIVVNIEMVNRFRDVKTEGDIYSWSQLLTSSDSRAVQDFFQAYRTSNFDEQSLEDIKLALDEVTREYLSPDSVQEDEYFAYIQRIKQEINTKLKSANAMALK